MANPTIMSIRRSAKRYGIDPRAAVAVALGEGGLVNREGDVGDLSGGGSYGPFQLYAQGALPSQYRGKPQQADAWAWSPQGVDYAIRKMAEAGARGLSGPAAVEAIVRKFERPADPDTSVQRATTRYGSITPQQYPALFASGKPTVTAGRKPPRSRPARVSAPASTSAGGSSLLASLLLSSPYDDEGAEPDDTLVRALSSRLAPPVAPTESPIASALAPLPTPSPGSAPPETAAAPPPTGGAYPFNFFRTDFTPLGAPGQGTHGFGERGFLWQDDLAYDYGAPAGTPIYVPGEFGQGVTVEEVRKGSTSGRFGGTKVYLRTPRGRVFLTHLGDVPVKAGQRLKLGDLIGRIGDIEGLSPHLHAAFDWLPRG